MSKKPRSYQDQSVVISNLDTKDVQIEMLAAHNVGLNETVDKLLKQLEEKTKQINHLEELLKNTPTTSMVTNEGLIVSSDELIIAEQQLKALRQASMMRDLTLDEVKRYDLLVKNKRLAEGNATEIQGKKPEKKSKSNLLQIAKHPLKVE